MGARSGREGRGWSSSGSEAAASVEADGDDRLMKLQLFRNHLASDLDSLPDVRAQEIQSYALTTAILVRRITERLKITDLNIPDAHNPQVHHGLQKVLNSFVHYRYFYPNSPVSMNDSEENIVLLESDRRNFRISLRSYFDIIDQFSRDDLFIGRYLFRRIITLLSQVDNQDCRDFDRSLLVIIQELVAASLSLSGRLVDSGVIEIPTDLVLDGYRHEVRWSETGGIAGWDYLPVRVHYVDIIAGYGSTWHLAPFVPFRIGIDNANPYMTAIERARTDGTGDSDGFLFPFDALLIMFKDALGRCEAASS